MSQLECNGSVGPRHARRWALPHAPASAHSAVHPKDPTGEAETTEHGKGGDGKGETEVTRAAQGMQRGRPSVHSRLTDRRAPRRRRAWPCARA
eukprot:3520468-Prymnesium_polylepis.1